MDPGSEFFWALYIRQQRYNSRRLEGVFTTGIAAAHKAGRISAVQITNKPIMEFPILALKLFLSAKRRSGIKTLQPRVYRFALEREHSKDALMNGAKRCTVDESMQRLQA